MFRNKAILTALADAGAGSLILVSHFFFPAWEDFILKFWALWQPFIGALILYYAVEPVKEVVAELRGFLAKGH